MYSIHILLRYILIRQAVNHFIQTEELHFVRIYFLFSFLSTKMILNIQYIHTLYIIHLPCFGCGFATDNTNMCRYIYLYIEIYNSID